MEINVIPLLPEIVMAVMVCIILLVGAFSRKQSSLAHYLSLLTLVAAVIVTAVVFWKLDAGKTILVFHHGFVLDQLAALLKIFMLVAVFLTFLYSHPYNQDRQIPITEFHVLGLLSTIGMMLLVSSHSLLMIFLSVELITLPTYAMVAIRRKQIRCVEAGMKYFIIGALATGMLLYGFSMIFGASHHLDIAAIAQQLTQESVSKDYVAIFGLVFAVAALAFKLGAAPFHMWVPDVFEGAPTSTTLFISTAPKIAGFGMAIRLLVGTLPALHVQWQEMLIVMAVLSMGIGNFAAIAQTNIKRMLAYSAVAHAGYTLLGIICATPRGYAASMFYILTYSLMTLASFGILLLLSRAGFECENIDDFKALNNRQPWLAFLMLIIMFSLAGVPPLVGFIAKVGLLEALIDVHLVWLAVVAILFAVVGAYYYIRVVKVIYFESSNEDSKFTNLNISGSSMAAISINSVAILILGLWPGALFSLCHMAFTV